MYNNIMILQEIRECQNCKKIGISMPLIYNESGRWVCPLCEGDN